MSNFSGDASGKATVCVVGAAIFGAGKCLVARRAPTKVLPLLWEFPGGKVEAGESPAAALVREIEEELGVHIEVEDSLGVSVSPPIRLEIFSARIAAGSPVCREHSELRWVREDEFEVLDFAPADVPLIEVVRRRLVAVG